MPDLRLWPRTRRDARTLLEPLPAGAARAPLRLSDADRARAAERLAVAQREGRFGASDEYERRLGQLAQALTQADADAVVGDLDDLVPDVLRRSVLDRLARAHMEGRIELDELTARTDRVLVALTRRDVDGILGDLGYRVAAPVGRVPQVRRRRRRAIVVARRVGIAAAAGGAIATSLVAVPCALDLPGPVGQWLPLAAATGAFGALGAATATLSHQVRAAQAARGRLLPGEGLRPGRSIHERRAMPRRRAAPARVPARRRSR